MIELTDAPQVATAAPDGSDVQWLAALGNFTALTYDYAFPGGANQLTGILQIPSASRVKAMDAGRRVAVYRGALKVWDGKMDEATATQGGWQITAQLTWQTCWVPQVVNGPPPAGCGANPVPGAQLNPVNWARNVNVHEIQSANGGG